MRIIRTGHFAKQLKALGKKYRSISLDVSCALNIFDKESAQSLGAKLYKVRVRSSDINKGKSGGFRIIVLCLEVTDMLIPVTIYQKAVQKNITEHELEYHLACVRVELTM